jgi:hypothetical protein
LFWSGHVCKSCLWSMRVGNICVEGISSKNNLKNDDMSHPK